MFLKEVIEITKRRKNKMLIKKTKQQKKEEQKSLLGKPKLFFEWLKEKFFKSDQIKKFLHNEIIDWLLLMGFLANFLNWILLVIFIHPVDVDIILHYNVYFGVDVIGKLKEVFLLPFIGLILLFINIGLAFYFNQQKKMIASYILLLVTLMIQINLIIASISIIIINH